MGSSFDKQEIISTPEAKGMRIVPSSRGVSVNASSLMARRGVGLKSVRTVRAGRAENSADYEKYKSEADGSSDAAKALQLLQVDTAKPGVTTSHETLRLTAEFAGLDDTEVIPADCQIASGPGRLVVVVNSAWGVFDKAGKQLLRRSFEDMFSGLVENLIIFSPKVIYDHFRGGWVMAACARSADNQKSSFLIAYSQTSDPLGDWWLWEIDARFDGANRTGHAADGIGLSADSNSLYLTANMFNGQGQFVYSKLRILNKKELQAGSVLHGWDFWQLRNFNGTPAFGLQPAINTRSTGSQYFLNANLDGQGLTLWTLSQAPRQTPTLSRKFVTTIPYQMAPNAKQQMTERQIETGDTRLSGVIFRHGLLWAAHTIAANWGEDSNVSAIQWFQINPRTGSVTQQGIFGAPHFHYFSPAITPDSEGNMILVFNRSGEIDFPEVRFTGRSVNDELNTLQASSLLQQSSVAGPSEWSIYSGAAGSPDESEVWVIGQYAATESDWATWIGALNYDLSARSVRGEQPDHSIFA